MTPHEAKLKAALAGIEKEAAPYEELASRLGVTGGADNWGQSIANLAMGWKGARKLKELNPDMQIADAYDQYFKQQREYEAQQKAEEAAKSERDMQRELQSYRAKKGIDAEFRQPEKEDAPEIVQLLGSMGIDPASPEGQQAIMTAKGMVPDPEKAPTPSFAEKEQIKGDQKRLNSLQESAATRQANIKKAQKFLEAFETGEAESGAGRKMLNSAPLKWLGTWTEQGEFDEEFDAFAEIAARQALKAAGEIRPTDADVRGMKEAMFGIARDEDVNIELLRDFLGQQKAQEDEYQSLIGGSTQPKGSTFTTSSGITVRIEDE